MFFTENELESLDFLARAMVVMAEKCALLKERAVVGQNEKITMQAAENFLEQAEREEGNARYLYYKAVRLIMPIASKDMTESFLSYLISTLRAMRAGEFKEEEAEEVRQFFAALGLTIIDLKNRIEQGAVKFY